MRICHTSGAGHRSEVAVRMYRNVDGCSIAGRPPIPAVGPPVLHGSGVGSAKVSGLLDEWLPVLSFQKIIHSGPPTHPPPARGTKACRFGSLAACLFSGKVHLSTIPVEVSGHFPGNRQHASSRSRIEGSRHEPVPIPSNFHPGMSHQRGAGNRSGLPLRMYRKVNGCFIAVRPVVPAAGPPVLHGSGVGSANVSGLLDEWLPVLSFQKIIHSGPPTHPPPARGTNGGGNGSPSGCLFSRKMHLSTIPVEDP
jgi:hypothetical protein